MGLCGKLVFLSVLAISVYVGIKINNLTQEVPLPVLQNTWWGPGKETKDDTSIRPFKIDIPDQVITDLKNRLANARPFVPPLEAAKQHYGMNTELLTEIVAFWKTKYVWKERQTFLNKFPQFKTQIQGLDIHYIHVKPKKTQGIRVLPLLMLHGWPGSIREFYDVIPLLTTPQAGKDFVFEVIVPSLPGYGFSQGASKQGLGTAEMAVVFKNLMVRLGIDKYYVQGGDWGSIIVTNMAALFKEHVLGLHANMCISNTPLTNLKLLMGSLYPGAVVEKKYESRMYPISSFLYKLMLEFGYMHLQATKPDTVGVGLNDSPVGLAAYIIEKFTTWTHGDWKDRSDGGLTIKYKYEDLLDNVMIYWVTNSVTTSMRLYSENFNIRQREHQMELVPVKVPTACARYARELAYQPDNFLKDKFHNLVYTSDFDDGGHFAAMEMPKVFAKDVFTGIEKMEQSKS